MESTIAVKHPDIRENRRTPRGVVLERSHRPGAGDVEIDAMGESVLARLDGRKTLETLRAEFAEEHRLSPPVYRRRVAFFTKDRSFDTSKVRSLLEWSPRYSNEDGIRSTALAYRNAGKL